MSPAIWETLRQAYFNSAIGIGVRNPAFREKVNGVLICHAATHLWAALKRLETGVLNRRVNMKSLTAEGEGTCSIEVGIR